MLEGQTSQRHQNEAGRYQEKLRKYIAPQKHHKKGTGIRKSVSVWVVAEQVYQSDQIATGIPYPIITYETNKGE